MNRRRLLASLLVGVAVGWGMWLAPLHRPRATLDSPGITQEWGLCYFSPDSRQIVTCHRLMPFDRLRGIARLWDTQTGELLATLAGGDALVRDIVFSPDGASIAGLQYEGMEHSGANIAVTWERLSGKLVSRQKRDFIEQLVYMDHGRLAYHQPGHHHQVRAVDTGEVLVDFTDLIRSSSQFDDESKPGYVLSFWSEPAARAKKGRCAVIHLPSGKTVAILDNVLTQGQSAVSADGRSLVRSIGNGGGITVWVNGRVFQVASSSPALRQPALSNGAAWLAFRDFEVHRRWGPFGETTQGKIEGVHLVEAKSGNIEAFFQAAALPVFSPDCRTLAVSLGNGDVQLWDLPPRPRWGLAVVNALIASAVTFLLLYWQSRRLSRSLLSGSPASELQQNQSHEGLDVRADEIT